MHAVSVKEARIRGHRGSQSHSLPLLQSDLLLPLLALRLLGAKLLLERYVLVLGWPVNRVDLLVTVIVIGTAGVVDLYVFEHLLRNQVDVTLLSGEVGPGHGHVGCRLIFNSLDRRQTIVSLFAKLGNARESRRFVLDDRLRDHHRG